MSEPGSLPLRVVFANHVSHCSGAERSLLSLMRRLPEHGVEPHLAAPAGPLAEEARALGLAWTHLPARRLRRTLNPFSMAGQLVWLGQVRRRVLALCQEAGAQVVHANSLATALALATRGPALPPLVWHCRDFHLHPRVVTWLFPRCAAVVAISRAVADRLLSCTGPAAARRLAVIHNGIGPEDLCRTRGREAVRQELGVAPDAPVVISVGQLVPWKRVDLILAAAEMLESSRPDLRWWIAGEALFPEDRATARRLRERAPGNVQFLGFREDVADLISAADVLAHAATEEAFGRALLEALYLETPCVAPAACGIPELLEHEVSGWLVEPGSATALAAGVAHLLDSPNLRASLVAAGADRARERFSAERSAARVAQLYQRVLEESHAHRL